MKNLKKLLEQRAEHKATMENLVNTADTEERAMTEDEQQAFDAAEAAIKAIDETIKRYNSSRKVPEIAAGNKGQSSEAEAEERAFADYILGTLTEQRAGEQNMTMGNNGAIIPTTISDRIIKAVKDRCPILERATVYQVKGTLKVPVWGNANNTHNIHVGYHSEFSELTADAGKFTSVDLGGYLAGALTLIGKSLENNGSFSVVDFIVELMAEEIALFIEGELLNGSGNSAAQGALNTTNVMTAASTAAVTSDELISLQANVKQAYQAKACWIVHPDTFTGIRKLKDGNNRYLLQDDITGEFPYRLLGKPVFLSDNMPKMEAGKKAILYGDCSGLSVNIREDIQIEVLREKYATQHAIGVVAWFEFDSKVTDNQKLAALAMKAG